jgi:hypothetical protein
MAISLDRRCPSITDSNGYDQKRRSAVSTKPTDQTGSGSGTLRSATIRRTSYTAIKTSLWPRKTHLMRLRQERDCDQARSVRGDPRARPARSSSPTPAPRLAKQAGELSLSTLAPLQDRWSNTCHQAALPSATGLGAMSPTSPRRMRPSGLRGRTGLNRREGTRGLAPRCRETCEPLHCNLGRNIPRACRRPRHTPPYSQQA